MKNFENKGKHTDERNLKVGDQELNTLGTGYLNCLYAYKRKFASPVLNVLKNLWGTGIWNV
jgi:hypothetical protein